MNTVKGEQARKDLPNPRFIATSIAFDFNGNNSAITKYNSER